ncbi:DUF6789 family protein, partial [Haladaptatus sp.]|uniref:DUF6789 family protein n=1 Tax=Haladaptatus sp. TaxID=1973141 RepID=UPI003C643610
IEPTEPETTRAAATDVPSEGSPNVFQGVRSLGVSFPRVVVAAAIGGLVGTVLMSGVLFTATILNVFSLSSFVNLAGFIGQQSVVVGYFLFLIGGMTTWALLFAVLAEYLPGEPRIITGLAFATVIAVGFALAFYTGQTGLHLLAYVIFVLIAHWFYGFGLSATFEYLTERWQVTE